MRHKILILQLLILYGLALLLPANLYFILVITMLLLPFINTRWRPAKPVHLSAVTLAAWSVITLLTAACLLHKPEHTHFYVSTLALAALPEEWFFRAYIQKQLGNTTRSILITSALFSALHILTRSPLIAALVFLPSLLYGVIYKKTNDLLATILCHACGNLMAVTFLNNTLNRLLS